MKKTDEKICLYCGKAFSGKGWIYCSQKCSAAEQNLKYLLKNKKGGN